ncbi:hypothetical protein XELAEV_18033265mg [Xenopus laevis]|uniref:PTB domain-containing protein n=1 Tax=Xenopus laevis TaxID=8355 RepID=A0A974CJ92_XENLA|nr:hypothetical protein XELAEV_18033265mg [Xenopus laevis]
MTVKFVQDTSKFWYKPDISRDQGLDLTNELVRHFLIECVHKEVRLKGCPNEPYFGSLTALVYQHSITPLVLPCKLLIPDKDPLEEIPESTTQTAANSVAELLKQGAAAGSASFVVTPLLFFRRHYPVNTVIFCALDPQDRKWTRDGLSSKRIHVGYPTARKKIVIHPEKRIKLGAPYRKNKKYDIRKAHKKVKKSVMMPPVRVSDCESPAYLLSWLAGVWEPRVRTAPLRRAARVFGFVARKGAGNHNICHLFAEHDPEQPASAIVNFVSKVMIGSQKKI